MRAQSLAMPLLAALVTGACTRARVEPGADTAPVFDEEVRPILQARCDACHTGANAAAGWRTSSFLEAIACVGGSGAPASLPPNAAAPILAALDSPAHQGKIDAAERSTLAAWILAGSRAFRGTVHDPGIVDPRSPAFHAPLLRAQRWRPMLDGTDPEACGRCHDGTPAKPVGVLHPAPAAPSCTTCHSQPGGVLACPTCHGDGATRAAPPRDPCFFAGDDPAKAGAHAAHLAGSPFRNGAALTCGSCHPTPDPADPISGRHADGALEIDFSALGLAEASWDPASHTCAVSCHDRGGRRPRPAWTDATPMGCNDCHRAPPPTHYAGSCTTCHHEANADGSALAPGPLHLNGKVDLGDGSGACGACHGVGADPWPTTNAHPSHKNPTLTTGVACTTCHAVPAEIHAPGHLDGTVTVTLSGRATDRGAAATWDGASCGDVACHGARLTDVPRVVPAWTDPSHAASACGSCHPIPPTQHTASTSCDRTVCHGAEIAQMPLRITEKGRTVHINGVTDLALP